MKARDPKLVDVRVRDMAPGAWMDGNGDIHFALPEILAFLGIPDIPEEREENMALLKKVMAEHLEPGREFITRHERPPMGPTS